jgi:hypothetical protein
MDLNMEFMFRENKNNSSALSSPLAGEDFKHFPSPLGGEGEG